MPLLSPVMRLGLAALCKTLLALVCHGDKERKEEGSPLIRYPTPGLPLPHPAERLPAHRGPCRLLKKLSRSRSSRELEGGFLHLQLHKKR